MAKRRTKASKPKMITVRLLQSLAVFDADGRSVLKVKGDSVMLSPEAAQRYIAAGIAEDAE